VLLCRARPAAVTTTGAKGRGDTKLTDVAEEMLPFIASRVVAWSKLTCNP
jgi:hypothetical protein